jgi:hypothetical protein
MALKFQMQEFRDLLCLPLDLFDLAGRPDRLALQFLVAPPDQLRLERRDFPADPEDQPDLRFPEDLQDPLDQLGPQFPEDLPDPLDQPGPQFLEDRPDPLGPPDLLNRLDREYPGDQQRRLGPPDR